MRDASSFTQPSLLNVDAVRSQPWPHPPIIPSSAKGRSGNRRYAVLMQYAVADSPCSMSHFWAVDLFVP